MAANLAELRQKAKLPARQAGGSNVQAFFEANRGTLAALLPSQMPVERMLKLALGALRTTPKLMECTTESLFGAVVVCAQLGLEPNTPLGHAYLIPFEKRAKRGSEWVTERTDVQVVIGYKGMLDLARRSGQIISISAREVRENDHFEPHYGTEERLEHRPVLRCRGEVIGFYAVAKLVGGGCAFEFMSREDVDAIRDASQGYKAAETSSKRSGRAPDSPWHNNYVEMGRKTVLRRLFKYLPISIEIANAAAIDERAVTAPAALDDTVLTAEYEREDDDAPAGMDPATGEIPPPAAQAQQAQPAQQSAPAAAPAPAQQQPATQAATAEKGDDSLDDWRCALADCDTAADCDDALKSYRGNPTGAEFRELRKLCEARKAQIAEGAKSAAGFGGGE